MNDKKETVVAPPELYRRSDYHLGAAMKALGFLVF